MSLHYGDLTIHDPFIIPIICCNLHNRDNSHLREVASRVAEAAKKSHKQQFPKSQGEHLPLNKEQKTLAMKTLLDGACQHGYTEKLCKTG